MSREAGLKLVLVTFCVFLSPFECKANEVIFDTSKYEVSNWREQASKSLEIDSAKLDVLGEKRCVKLNNYWCLKDMNWNGSLGRDSDRHAAFQEAELGARAAARNLRTAYFLRGRKTAFEVMSTYAPPTDCIGSNAARLKDGTCKNGYNPTLKYATTIAGKINKGPHDDMELFDRSTKMANGSLAAILQAIAKFETGISVKSELVLKGICLENDSCDSDPIASITRKPICPSLKTNLVSSNTLRDSFKAAYCSGLSTSRCAARWSNFSLLIDRMSSDNRVSNIPTAAFILAAAHAETGINDFSPNTKERKGKVNESHPYWLLDAETGKAYFGRGWIQLTWKDKYALASKHVDRDLVKDPDLALTPDIAYEVLVRSLIEGWLETYRSSASGLAGSEPIRLGDFITEESIDYASARSVINANCKGRCSPQTRVMVSENRYIPLPDHIDAARAVESDSIMFETILCASAQTNAP